MSGAGQMRRQLQDLRALEHVRVAGSVAQQVSVTHQAGDAVGLGHSAQPHREV